MFTQGRLVPRQPWAIKRTTPTALCNEGISIAKHIHWNTGITPTVLYRYNIYHDSCIHRNIGTTLTALHGCNIQMMECFLLFHVQSLHKSADDFWLSGVFSEVFGELTCIIIVGPTLCYFRCNKFNDNIHWLNTFEIIGEMSTYSE